MRRALLAIVLFVSACALSHVAPDVGPADLGAPLDLGTDLGPPDLGTDLGPPPDLGTLHECREQRDCRPYLGTVCRADPLAAPDDLLPIHLVCAPPNATGGAAGALCDDREPTSCQTGLCVVGGTCVEPCVPDGADSIADRCATVWVRTASSAMQSVTARTLRVLAVDGLDVTDLGIVTVPAGSLDTRFALTLPHATDVVVFDGPEGVVFGLGLETAGGTLLYDYAATTTTSPAQAGPLSSGQSLPTVEIPNSPREPRDPAGGYVVTLGSNDGATMHAIGLGRSASLTTLDVDVFYAGATGYFGRALVPILADAVEHMRTTYAAAGIRIGDVRVHELVGGLRERWAVLPDPVAAMDVRIDGLFTLSAGVPTASVSWFFIRAAGTVLGLAGGIPGPSPVAGSPGSGVLISADAIGMFPGVTLAATLEHETGHYLGLFHTSEVDGTVVEPLADTPECRPVRDRNHDGVLDTTECAGSGAENPMFWAGDETGAGFSPEQASVIARSPALH